MTTEHVEHIGPVERLRLMLLIRRFEERCAELYAATKIRGFLHLYVGEEAIAAGLVPALGPQDALVGTYREHGHALARGISARLVMAEMFGKAEGCSRGRGGSMHLFDAATRFYGGNGIVAGGLPVAVGLGLASAMRHRQQQVAGGVGGAVGNPRAVTACFFGEGAVAEGEFHESLNLAALWKLPVLFCCENNLYAMGTALARSEAQTDLALKAASYGLAAWAVDGMDPDEVAAAGAKAVAMAADGGGPVFLELKTYRFRAHSMYDPDRYRSKEEIGHWRERDPIPAYRARLTAAGALDDDGWAALEASVTAEIDDAVAFAEAGTLEPVEDLTRFVTSARES